jgi:hypothetical protein
MIPNAKIFNIITSKEEKQLVFIGEQRKYYIFSVKRLSIYTTCEAVNGINKKKCHKNRE